VTALAIVLWTALGLIVYAHVGYPLLLAALVRLRRRRAEPRPEPNPLPRVSLIVAAHDEEEAIERRIENAIALDYPPERLEVIVASDGSTDRTVERSRAAAALAAGRVRVLDLSRRGKVRAQDAAVDEASGDLLAFSDANALWKPDALRLLVTRLANPRTGYVCGQLRYLAADGTNQEGLYWRYETAVRALETRAGSVTAGNGAIYAVERDAYLRLDPRTSHDLSFPFNLVKRGRRAVYEPRAIAIERPLASIEGEFRRKRRMMSHTWPAVLAGGMLDPRGYGFLYALEIYSHRLLRYSTPVLHLVALGVNVPLAFGSTLYQVTLAAQVVFVLAAALGRLTAGRPRVLGLAYYYVLVTASLGAGLWDWLRHGTPATWERAEGRP
jgi:cellulose synthase/poly-beta-1,6-N-acetylglucosamine synthase-like glycosyltransferase